MSMHFSADVKEARKVIDLVRDEREKALSKREWKHRLAGHGYSIAETTTGQIVTELLSGNPVCVLPPELSE